MRNSLLKTFHRCKRGAVAIEFAFILAFVLLPLIFAILEFSLIMFSSSAIESATNISSRLGRTGYDPGLKDDDGNPVDRKDYIRQQLQRSIGNLIDAQNIKIETVVYPAAGGVPLSNADKGDDEGEVGASGDYVEYIVRYDWPVQTPFMGKLIGDEEGKYPIVARTMVRNE